MSAPLIFNGRRAKMLTQDGILRADGSIIDNNGVPNLIKNGHAEINVTGWTVSKNTVAASRPDSGFVTSSTNITWTRNTTNPIDGQADFLYTKDAANRQGEQVYCGFTVAKKYRAKVLQIEIDYLVNSGTFSAGSSSTDSDVIVYIYDVTNSTFIEPSSFKFLSNSSTIADKFVANFQTSATGSSYRILFHQATNFSSAFAVQFKEVRVSPCNYVYGTPITDWQSYTPTLSGGFSNGNSNASVTGKWRRVGDSIELDGKITVGSSNTFSSSHLQISLPSGLSWDTSKIAFEDNVSPIGFAQVYDSSFGGGFKAFPVKYGTTTFSINTPFNNSFSGTTFERLDFNGVATGTTHPFAWANGDIINFKIEAMPITGWSSSTQVSDGYDGRQIAISAQNNANVSAGNGSTTKMTFGSKVFDSTNSWNTSTNTFTAPTSGLYRVTSVIGYPGTSGTGARVNIIYKNGSSYSQVGIPPVTDGGATQVVNSADIQLNAGDTIEIYALQTGGGSMTINGSTNQVHISKLQSPQTISATEVVAARYAATTSQSGSTIVIDYNSKVFDTHNAASGSGSSWKWTAPVAGLYEISSLHLMNGGTSYAIGTSLNLNILKNGSFYDYVDFFIVQATANMAPVVGKPFLIQLNAGEYIQQSIDTNNGSKTMYSAGCYIQIKRVK